MSISSESLKHLEQTHRVGLNIIHLKYPLNLLNIKVSNYKLGRHNWPYGYVLVTE